MNKSLQRRADEIVDRWNKLDGAQDTPILRAEMACLSVELGMIVKNCPEVVLKERNDYEPAPTIGKEYVHYITEGAKGWEKRRNK
jgi:hypothetical protein